MIRLFITLVGLMLLPVLALAQQTAPAPSEPALITLPSSVVRDILQYLNTRPYAEAAPLIMGIQRCVQDQIPDAKGTISNHGSCPEIAAAPTPAK